MAIRFDYRDKIVLITGGTQGIGLGIANAFARAGATIHITGTRDAASSYESDLSAFTYHQLRLQDDVARRDVAGRFDRLDILVNNAGFARDDEYTDEGYAEVIEVNLNAAVAMCYLLKDRLSESRGAIVNVASVGSFIGLRDRPAYTASKTGLLGFTRSIGDMWAKHGIRINAVAPGFIDTQIIEWARQNEDMHQASLKSIPARRFGRPDEVADAVLFLAAPEAEYIRGQSLIIDGGYLLR